MRLRFSAQTAAGCVELQLHRCRRFARLASDGLDEESPS